MWDKVTRVSFVNSLKGRVNVLSGGIRVWTNGNITLEAEGIADGGQKITLRQGTMSGLGVDRAE